MDTILEIVKDFADKAHGEQRRKYTPERYIVHPIRVMNLCAVHVSSLSILAAALLHDVLEDTPTSAEEILAFLQSIMPVSDARHTLQLVNELTDEFVKDKYPYWNRKKRKRKEVIRLSKVSADAQTIKYADIIDNSGEIAAQDPEFAPRYLLECKELLRKMDKGHPVLYAQAKETVEVALQSIGQKS